MSKSSFSGFLSVETGLKAEVLAFKQKIRFQQDQSLIEISPPLASASKVFQTAKY